MLSFFDHSNGVMEWLLILFTFLYYLNVLWSQKLADDINRDYIKQLLLYLFNYKLMYFAWCEIVVRLDRLNHSKDQQKFEKYLRSRRFVILILELVFLQLLTFSWISLKNANKSDDIKISRLCELLFPFFSKCELWTGLSSGELAFWMRKVFLFLA